MDFEASDNLKFNNVVYCLILLLEV
jgi:hypothetical protein